MHSTRRLRPSDSQHYSQLRLSALEESPLAFYPTPAEQLETPVSLVASASGFVVGAFSSEGKLVGIAGVTVDTREKRRHRGMVWGFYVAPSARRGGVGRLLMEKLVAVSREEGLSRLTLSVISTQEAAARLYRSCGFEPFGVEPDAIRVEGKSYDEQFLSLGL